MKFSTNIFNFARLIIEITNSQYKYLIRKINWLRNIKLRLLMWFLCKYSEQNMADKIVENIVQFYTLLVSRVFSIKENQFLYFTRKEKKNAIRPRPPAASVYWL